MCVLQSMHTLAYVHNISIRVATHMLHDMQLTTDTAAPVKSLTNSDRCSITNILQRWCQCVVVV